MRFFRPLSLVLVALPVLSFPIYAKASDVLVFELSQSQVPTNFSTGTGIAQGVYADQTTTIDSFGFDLKQANGGNVNYFIYDATTSSLVLSPEAVAAPSKTKAYTYLTGLSVTLAADNLYYFGVYGNDLMTVNMDPTEYDSIGLSLPTTGATSFDITGTTLSTALSNAINSDGLSTNSASLRVFSDPPDVAPTPEPSSLILMGTGILAAAGAIRKRMQ